MTTQDFISLLGAGSGVGGIVGAVGGIATGILSFFQKKSDQKHDLEMFNLGTERLKMQANIDQAQLAGMLTLQHEKGAGDAFVESQKAEQALGVATGWAGAFRQIIRPGLTIHSWILADLLIGFYVYMNWGKNLFEDPIFIFMAVFVFSSASMFGSWWFGQRQLEKALSWGNSTASASVKSTANTLKK